MLENSVWKQYNDTKTIAQAISEMCKIDIELLKEDEGELYASLKRHLTKKELRYFVLKEADFDKATIASMLEMDDETVDKTARKVNRKIKQDKIMNEVKCDTEE